MCQSLGGWGSNICCVQSAQDSAAAIVKHGGEARPPRASVLMCLACSELSLHPFI